MRRTLRALLLLTALAGPCAASALEQLPTWGPAPLPPPVAVPARAAGISGDVSPLALPYFLGGRRAWVYLPPGYGGSSRRYPVVYMQDGQNLFDPAASYSGEWRVDETCEALMGAGDIIPFIVVGVENGGAARMVEYTPWPDPEHGGGGADAYLSSLKTVLKPEIDRRYSTLPDPAHTYIAGSSLGGLLAAYAGFSDPGTWGGVIALSPSYWWADEKFKAWAAGRPKPQLKVFYQDMGTLEGSDHAKYMETLRAVERTALAKGFREGEDLYSMEIPGHNHSEASWSQRLPWILKLLFPARP